MFYCSVELDNFRVRLVYYHRDDIVCVICALTTVHHTYLNLAFVKKIVH
jgi:hypothetical protein